MAKSSSKKPATARSRKVRSSKPKQARSKARKPSRACSAGADKQKDATSKQSRVIAMLQAPQGTTLAAMIHATGWQQHSVRGFLAGVVRKKLKLKLVSSKVDDKRVYRIETRRQSGKAASQPEHGAA